MANYINIIAELRFPELMWGVVTELEADVLFDNNIAYKAMLFINNDGEFVPVITFRNPFEGKRILHRIIGGVPCNNVEGSWNPSEGVSILWGRPDGTAHYTCAPLTAWERFHKLTFITSFGWMKGWSVKEAFNAISFFAYLGTDDYSTIEKWGGNVDDDSILGIVRSSYFRNAYRDAMGMKKPVAPNRK